MALIPDDFIQDLLNRVDIVDVVERYLPLKKAGQNYMACCPFHKEKSPSFTVSQTKQFYHCFGCGVHGSALTFVMEHQALSFPEAVRQLAESVGMQVPVSDKPVTEEQKKAPGIYDVLKVAFDFYRAQLKTAPAAIDYFKRRGVEGKTAAKFGLGYAPGGDDWQPLKAVYPDYDWNSILAEAGLVIDKEESKRRYDRFRERVMFPIINQRGQVIGFGGRVMGQGEPKYLNSPETPVFTKGRELYGLPQARTAIRDHNRVLVAEGYMDVVMLHQHGVEYAVASLGTACTPEHVRKLLKLADEVVFGFDGDKAGIRAAWRALENSLPEVKDGKELKFLFLPAEHDPDSYVQAFGKAQFELLIAESALPLSQYLLKELAGQVDLTMEEGRARLVHIARPYLDELTQAPILKLMIGKRLAEMCQLSSAEFASLQAVASAPKVLEAPSDWGVEPEMADWQVPQQWQQAKSTRREPFSRGGGYKRGKGKGWNMEEPRPRLKPAGQYDPVSRALELVLFRPSLLLGQEPVELTWPVEGLHGLARAVFTIARQAPDLQGVELLARCRELPNYSRLSRFFSEQRALFEKFDEEDLQVEIANSLLAATQNFSLGSTLSRKEELDILSASRGLTDEESQEYLALLLRH
ncbi:DNA primase [Deefgea tanakiae]|uniref:DNA primase n=1 Tax=Deefgea tanakiae TaxID=2865840 RepID=A0ABX8ZAI7_9NEIS|nr:DNA primase [Deefgea tanakiae]QZA78180.1 DNA primase [Deefgea tanakiae]